VFVAGSLVGGGGGIAAEHGPRPPAGQAHEATLGAAGVEEGVGEGVAELVGTDVGEPGGRADVRKTWTVFADRFAARSDYSPRRGGCRSPRLHCYWCFGPRASVSGPPSGVSEAKVQVRACMEG
jgi:hypothetical protein